MSDQENKAELKERKAKAAILRELASTKAGATFTCNSASMEPTIKVGESVRIYSVDPPELKIGDVVVFEGADFGYILHRIVFIFSFMGLGPKWFLHIGDAGSSAGPRRAMIANIVGKSSHSRKRPNSADLIKAVNRKLRTITRPWFYF